MNKGSNNMPESGANLETVSDNFLDITTMPDFDTSRAWQTEKHDLHLERQNFGTVVKQQRSRGQGLEYFESTKPQNTNDSNNCKLELNDGKTDLKAEPTAAADPTLERIIDGFATASLVHKLDSSSQSDTILDNNDRYQFTSQDKSIHTDSLESKFDLQPRTGIISGLDSQANTAEISVTTETGLYTENPDTDNLVEATPSEVSMGLNRAEHSQRNMKEETITVSIIEDGPGITVNKSVQLRNDITSVSPETVTKATNGKMDALLLKNTDFQTLNQAANMSSFVTPQTSPQNSATNITNDDVTSVSTQMLLNSAHDTISTSTPVALETDKTTSTEKGKTVNFIYKTYTVTSSGANSQTVFPVVKTHLTTTTGAQEMDKAIFNADMSTTTPSKTQHSTTMSTVSNVATGDDRKTTSRRGNKNRKNNRKPNRRGDRKNKTMALTSASPVKSIHYSSQSTSPRSIIALDNPALLPGDAHSNRPVLGISTTHVSETDTTVIGNKGLGTGAEIGIIIASIALFWLILGPLLCIICRVKMRAKERSNCSHNDDMGTMLVEEMIRLELAKGRDKMYQTSVSDVMEIERLSANFNGDYENFPNQNPGILPHQSAGILANQSSIMSETQYANVHGDLYGSINGKKNLMHQSDIIDETKFMIIPSSQTMDIYSECDEGRDTITSISTPMMSRDVSQLTNFTGYRSNGSVSVDSGFDNRCSIKHENSNISMDRCDDRINEATEKPIYKGYTPVRLDSSSIDKSVDSSPAFCGYANIRQLNRDHESAGSLTNDDTTSVDSTSFDDVSHKMAAAPCNKEYHSTPKLKNNILDPTKYLICNNHIGSLEKTGNPRNSLIQHGGECRCAFREPEAKENCECRAQSMEYILATDNLSNGSHGDSGQSRNSSCSSMKETRCMDTVV